MSQNKAPDGYVFDSRTGMYFHTEYAPDETGRKSRIVTYYNPETGEFIKDQKSFNSPSNFDKTKQGPQRGGIDFNKKMRNKIIGEILAILLGILIVIVLIFLGISRLF